MATAQRVVDGSGSAISAVKVPSAEVRAARDLLQKRLRETKAGEVKSRVGCAITFLDETVIRRASIQDEAGRNRADPVEHIRIIDSLERLLAIGARLVVDAIHGAILRAVVGSMPDKRAVLVAKVPIEFQDQVIELVRIKISRPDEIVSGIAIPSGSGLVWRRHKLRDRGRDGVDHGRRDFVAREWNSNRISVPIPGEIERIVDRNGLSLRVHQLRKVARAHLRLWPGNSERIGRAFPVILETAEVEEFHTAIGLQEFRDANRSFELEAVLIQIVLRSRFADGVVLECVGVERRAAQVLPTGGVERVRAAFEHDVHDPATRVAVLGAEGVRHHAEFLHGIDDGHVRDVIEAHLPVIRSAVQHELGRGIAAAVDGPLCDRAVVERTLPDGRAVEGDAGHHRAEHERVAGIQGKL